MDDLHHGPGRYGAEDRSGGATCVNIRCDAVVIDPYPEWHSRHGEGTGYCPACEERKFRRRHQDMEGGE